MSRPVAVLTSDWHLWGKPPVFRSEDDWFGVMGHAVGLVAKYAARFGIPVLVAGDVFDSYNPACELLNSILEWIPGNLRVYAVPGQHDLQNHNLEAIGRTGFETLGRIGRIAYIRPNSVIHLECNGMDISVKGLGWGSEDDGSEWGGGDSMNILLHHRYVYSSKETSYADAPEEFRADNVMEFKNMRGRLKIAVFGDNHIPFSKKLVNGNIIVNCGTLICRKADEKRDKAGFYVLFDDGSVRRVPTGRDSDLYLDDAGTGTPDSAVRCGMNGLIGDDEIEVPDFETEVRKRVELTRNETAIEFVSAVFESCRRALK